MARFAAGLVGLWLLCSGAMARAEIVHYLHPHPMPPGVSKGMCYIEGPHVHSFRPHKPLLYIEVNGGHAFIGDHTEFAPEEKKYAYYGHHPVFWVDKPGKVQHYCYITGPHHHYYPPPPEMKFEVKGGVYWYVGAHPGWYRKRYRRYRPVDRYYARAHIIRPVVTVQPPVGFVGVYIGAGGRARAHGRIHGGVHVVAPPPPGIDINIHLPGVGVVVGGGPRLRRGVVVHHPPGHRVKYKKYRVKHRGPAASWGHRGGKRKIKLKVRRGGTIKVKRRGKGRRK